MKKLLVLLLAVPVLGFGQGEQRYADGTATDQDGNTFEWINYGTQDWAIENAEVVTYRDGTPIPQVTDPNEWSKLMTGAWCYVDNDPTKGKLYNVYAIFGVDQGYEQILYGEPKKNFAPEGWSIPDYSSFEELREYLSENYYSYYGGGQYDNSIAKSVASTSGWYDNNDESTPGTNQALNNKSGFNGFPWGYRHQNGDFYVEGNIATFWYKNFTEIPQYGHGQLNYTHINCCGDSCFYDNGPGSLKQGRSVRFVRDASTASTKDYTDAITIYPNPSTSIVTLQGDNEYDIEVYNLQGKKVMALTGNTIDISHLSSATYIVKALDKVENEEVSYKVVKN